MKKVISLVAILCLAISVSFGQWLLTGFEEYPDPNLTISEMTTDRQHLNLSQENVIVHDGSAALKVEWQNEAYDQYGGWIDISYTYPDSEGFFDLSPYSEISFWYYNEQPASMANNVLLRIILDDGGEGSSIDDPEQWCVDRFVLDDSPGWNQYVINLDNADISNPAEGPELWQNPWGGCQDGNKVLDKDKIHRIMFEWSQNGTLHGAAMDTVSGVIIFDNLEAGGQSDVNLIFFNGKSIPSNVSLSVGWSGTTEITDEEDAGEQTTSIKWTTGEEWDGIFFDLASPKNLQFAWQTDTLQFKIKTSAGLGDLLIGFADTDEDEGTADYAFQAIYVLEEAAVGFDDTWKQVKIPLVDFDRFAGVWDDDIEDMVDGEFDSSQVSQFFIADLGEQGWVEGKTVYFDEIWTGNPEFDWIPPAQVQNVSASAQSFYNLVFWDGLESEVNETYTVYASPHIITDINAEDIDVVDKGVTENTLAHYLFYPLVDHDVEYWYAVTASDNAGNIGEAGLATGSLSNTARGVPTIALGAPAGFAVDGDFNDWYNSGILPFEITTTNTSYGLPSSQTASEDFSGAEDLSATVYLAIDDDYLYIAADVIDDSYNGFTGSGNSWEKDQLEFYIGLFDWRGPAHTSVMRGSEPDFAIVFNESGISEDYTGAAFAVPDDPDYFFEGGPQDYYFEARISLDSLAIEDDRFHPVNGMRIPLDLYFHDNDGSDADWSGLALSPDNTDMVYLDPSERIYTWIGDKTTTINSIDRENISASAHSYRLSQNYPNPFNPITQIRYSIEKTGLVQLDIFNVRGQLVSRLLNEERKAGEYTINWNAENFPTGMYFCRIVAGDFSSTIKMLLMK